MSAKYSAKRQIGNVGEDIACRFLQNKGFTLIERNFLRPWGEIDIIAEKAGVIRFVEVKAVSREIGPGVTREKDGYRPEEQVHPAKLKKLCRTAETYMQEKAIDRDYQIDVVTVYMDHAKRVARCTLYEQVL